MSALDPQGNDDSYVKNVQQRGFFDKSRGVRYALTLGFVIVLFLFIHIRQMGVESLEVGTRAQRYVVSQVTFAFKDEEATTILRQEAVRDIGKIFRIKDSELRQQRTRLENHLTAHQEWRQEIVGATFEDMYRALDSFDVILKKIRFTDPRTLRKMRELQMDTSMYKIFTPVDLSQSQYLPAGVWKLSKQLAFAGKGENEKIADYIIDQYEKQEWTVDEDTHLARELRSYVQGFVHDKYTEVGAGQPIIDQGELVSSRHIAMLQAMKRALAEKRNLWSPAVMLGSLLLTILLTAISVSYLKSYSPEIVHSNKSLFLLVTIVLLTILMAKFFEYAVLAANKDMLDVVRYPLFAPFAAILLCSLMSPSIAAYASGLIALVLSLTLSTDRQAFLLTNIAASLVAIVSTRSLQRRKEIFIVCGQAWLGCAVVILAFLLYEDKLWNISTVVDLATSCAFMLVTAIIVVGVLPILESAFDIMTDVTLMEYMDPNHELLRRLAIEAPGTYQHSVIMGNLAEAAACAIGANGLFCRVSTLFHDVGKLATPQYFTENQQGGMNIHQLLTPRESAQVIMDHVTEGVVMARKSGLPEPFIDIIKEHHGTTMVYYFYRKALEQKDGDSSLIDEYEFRYKGPKPSTKESMIIMIADSLEAASRSLEEVNEKSLMNLVNKLIEQKFEDGQFTHSTLSFEELERVKRAMVKTLLAAGHSRVKYPQREAK